MVALGYRISTPQLEHARECGLQFASNLSLSALVLSCCHNVLMQHSREEQGWVKGHKKCCTLKWGFGQVYSNSLRIPSWVKTQGNEVPFSPFLLLMHASFCWVKQTSIFGGLPTSVWVQEIMILFMFSTWSRKWKLMCSLTIMPKPGVRALIVVPAKLHHCRCSMHYPLLCSLHFSALCLSPNR